MSMSIWKRVVDARRGEGEGKEGDPNLLAKNQDDLGLDLLVAHALEGVVLLALTEGRAVDVGREPAEAGEDAGVEGSAE